MRGLHDATCAQCGTTMTWDTVMPRLCPQCVATPAQPEPEPDESEEGEAA
jgi:hypothetical protein